MQEQNPLERAAALENDFMARVAASVSRATVFTGGPLVHGHARRDDGYPGDFEEEVRRVLSADGLPAGDAAERVPRGARVLYEVRKGLLGRHPALFLAAGVRHPFRALSLGLPVSPLPAADALAALPPDREAPLQAVVLSTSGWVGEPPRPVGVALWLVSPAPGGGYRLEAGPGPLPAHFSLETDEELVMRVVGYAWASRAELVLNGLDARRVAETTGAPLKVVEAAFRRMASRDEFLAVHAENGTVVLRRI